MKEQQFKPYTPKQAMLMPANLDEMIPEGHLVRVVDEMIDLLDIAPLKRQYKGGGTSAYHPRMLLKVLVYAYSQQTFSSRKIAKALRENIHYMWLSGMSQPDHRTINRFRGVVMKEVVEEVFYGIVEQLFELGYVDLEKYFVDGTKIEANANRYSFVWKKSTDKYKANLQEKVRKLLDDIEEIEAEEEERYGDKDYPEMGEGIEIDAEKMKKAVDKINQKLRKNPKNKKLKKAKKDLEQDFIPREEKYEKYEETLGDRNSFSKTDEDATFMRMKEDHMRNGQLKPGYNIQMGTENQFITGFSIHQNPGDTSCLKDHLEQRKRWLGEHPQVLIADAGYGSEENYDYLKDRNITAYVKYNLFHYEQKKRYQKKKAYRQENFIYQKEKDQYLCPQGKVLSYQFTKEKYNRRIYIGVKLLEMRKTARELLTSPEGVRMRSQRPIEVEAVYGRLKHNWGFRRFLLRGVNKVKIEWGR